MKVDEKIIKKCYYIAMIAALAVFAVSIPLTHGNSMKVYLWKAGSSFYDFFYCIKSAIYWNRTEIYQTRNIYPPLANVFYMMITACMSGGTLQKMLSTGVNDLKMLQECAFYFVLYMNVLLLFFSVVCASLKKGTKAEKIVFTISMLFTVPFLYQYERGNIIFLALCFTMLFFLWKDSENRILRELSFFSLAGGAGLKIYPAVFGLLLVREKRYKEAVRLMIYGLLSFFLPFLCFGSFLGNIKKMISNMKTVTAEFASVRVGCQLNYSATLKNLLGWMGNYSVAVITIVLILAFALGILAALGLKEKWKLVLLLTTLMMGIPSFSYTYVGIFMVLPVIAFLDGSETHKKRDLVYLVGMLLVLLPLPFCWMEGAGDPAYTYLNVSTPVLVEGCSILVMTVFLILEGLGELWHTTKHRILLLVLAVVLFVASSAAGIYRSRQPYDFTNYLKKTLGEATEIKDGDCLAQEFQAKGTRIDRIVLKLNPAKEGVLTCRISEKETGKTVWESSLQSADLKNGYNEIVFDATKQLEKDSWYEVVLEPQKTGEGVYKIYHTAEHLKSGGAYATLNETDTGWYLGVQIYQYGGT